MEEDSSIGGSEIDASHLTQPLCSNPLIPFWARLVIPISIFVNLILFIIGDTGDAVRIDVVGEVMKVPIRFDEFQTLSVISSVLELWKGGAYLLAILLFSLSIAWPYIKLFFLIICWTCSPRYFRKI